MRVAIFGGTGAIGRHVVDEALDAGHHVRAFARDIVRLPQHERLQPVEGSLDDGEAIASTVAGCHAVVNALSPQSNSRAEMEEVVGATRHILQAAEQAGARRIVMLSGAAVSVPGERKNTADAIASRVVRVFARWVVETRQRELDLLRASALEWVAVRPARVDDGPLTRRYRAGRIAVGPGSRISRADLGHFMVEQLTDGTHVTSAPFISY